MQNTMIKNKIMDWLEEGLKNYQDKNNTYYLISESGINEANTDGYKQGFIDGVSAALGYIEKEL